MHIQYPLMKGTDWYLKGSFDKANRTSLYGGRGPGLEESLDYLLEIKIGTPMFIQKYKKPQRLK